MSETGEIKMTQILERKLVVMSKEAVESVVEFFKVLPKMTVIPCDDGFGAVKGFITFTEPCDDNVPFESASEVSLWFGWQFAKPVKDEDCNPIPIDERAETLVNQCTNEDGWVPLDDPINRVLGFVKYAPLDSKEDTKAVLLNLSGLKQFPKEMRDRIVAWRTVHLPVRVTA